MDPLIITVAGDSTVAYPGNKAMPPVEDTEAVGQQYIDAVLAGATITHLHGVRYLEKGIQADGKQVSRIDFDGWTRLKKKIETVGTSPVIQYGVAAARIPDKVRMMADDPDMMSYAFNPHDEFFQPDPAYPANEMYALHPRNELAEFSQAALDHGVKPEVECFYTGAFWNLEFIRKLGLLKNPVWATLFLGWKGGTWTPATHEALTFMVQHLPEQVNWNLSVMDPMHWRLIPHAISLGGHIRVGWEDYPFHPDGTPAQSNAELVDIVVGMAKAMGRPVATVEQTREIVGLD
jgi:3-keto-5-aminohexanoate cleavage enzyme